MDGDLDEGVLEALIDTAGLWDVDVSPAEADMLLGSVDVKTNVPVAGLDADSASAKDIDIDDVDWEAMYAAGVLDSPPPSPRNNPSGHGVNILGAFGLPWQAPPPPPRACAGEGHPSGSDGIVAAGLPGATEVLPTQGCRPTSTYLMPNPHAQAQASGATPPCPPSLPPLTPAVSSLQRAATACPAGPEHGACSPVGGTHMPIPELSTPPPSAPTAGGTISPAAQLLPKPPAAAATRPPVEHTDKDAAAATAAACFGTAPDASTCVSASDTLTAVAAEPLLASMVSDLSSARTAASPLTACGGGRGAGAPWPAGDAGPLPMPLLQPSQSQSQASSCISASASVQHAPPVRYPPIFAAPPPRLERPSQPLPERSNGTRSAFELGAVVAPPAVFPGACPSGAEASGPLPLPSHAPHILRRLTKAAAAVAAAASLGLPPPHLMGLLPAGPALQCHPSHCPSASRGSDHVSGPSRDEQCLQDLLEIRRPAAADDANGSDGWGWAVGCRCGCVELSGRARGLRRSTLPSNVRGHAPHLPYHRARFASGGGVGAGNAGRGGGEHTGGAGEGDAVPKRSGNDGTGGAAGLPLPAGCVGVPQAANPLSSDDLELGLSEMEEELWGASAEGGTESAPPVLRAAAGAGTATPRARHSSTGGVGCAVAVPQWRHAWEECEVDDNEEHLQLLREAVRRSGGSGGFYLSHGSGFSDGGHARLLVESPPLHSPAPVAISPGACPGRPPAEQPDPYGVSAAGGTGAPAFDRGTRAARPSIPGAGVSQLPSPGPGPQYPAPPLPPPAVRPVSAPSLGMQLPAAPGPAAAPPPCSCPDCRRQAGAAVSGGPAGALAAGGVASAAAGIPVAAASRGFPTGQTVGQERLSQPMAPGQHARCMLPCCNPAAPTQPPPVRPPVPALAPASACAPLPCHLPCCNPAAVVSAGPLTASGAADTAPNVSYDRAQQQAGTAPRAPAATPPAEAAAPHQWGISDRLPMPHTLPAYQAAVRQQAAAQRSRLGRSQGSRNAASVPAGGGARSVRPRYAPPAAQEQPQRPSSACTGDTSGAGRSGGVVAATTSSGGSFATRASPRQPLAGQQRRPAQQHSPEGRALQGHGGAPAPACTPVPHAPRYEPQAPALQPPAPHGALYIAAAAAHGACDPAAPPSLPQRGYLQAAVQGNPYGGAVAAGTPVAPQMGLVVQQPVWGAQHFAH